MKIFPAIDISSGQVVRLTKGDYNKMKVYSESPQEVIRQFKAQGAEYLHAVDLDGAKHGSLVNLSVMEELASGGGMFIEAGGGIRDEEKIKAYLSAGVSRVILGTVAVKNFDFTRSMIEKYGDKIAVGVDAKDGFAAVSGWLEKTGADSVEFCERLAGAGLKTVIYTDISRDGMLGGCNLEIYERLCRIPGLEVIASGGVCTTDEIKKLKAAGCGGAIIGKAIYEGKITLAEALFAAGEDL